MAVLVDTSVLIDVERRGHGLDLSIGDEERAISAVTASELLHGVLRARDAAIRVRRQAFVEHLLSSIEPLPITLRVARTHAELWAKLEQSGQLIGAHDLWIAATAVSNGMKVATSNTSEFGRVPGLDLVALS